MQIKVWLPHIHSSQSNYYPSILYEYFHFGVLTAFSKQEFNPVAAKPCHFTLLACWFNADYSTKGANGTILLSVIPTKRLDIGLMKAIVRSTLLSQLSQNSWDTRRFTSSIHPCNLDYSRLSVYNNHITYFQGAPTVASLSQFTPLHNRWYTPCQMHSEQSCLFFQCGIRPWLCTLQYSLPFRV